MLSDQVLQCLSLVQQYLDAATSGIKGGLVFVYKYGKDLSCPNIYVKYGISP